MTPFDVAAILIVLAALFGLANHHWLGLPQSIGLVVIALLAALAVMGLDRMWPALGMAASVRAVIAGIDFHATLMEGMLSLLLFAGALHVDLGALLRERWTIGLTATVGVLVSAAIVGLGFHWLTGVPILVALVFGALISPTDPVAVLGLLKSVRVPEAMETRIAGESLFNDGIGVVLFLILSALAFGGHGAPLGAGDVALLALQEVGGGAVLGLVAGLLAYHALRSLDEHNLEVIVTLALVMGTYALANAFHLSGPIAVVIAGLFIGNRGVAYAMSAATRTHVRTFWSLGDEILNAVLFLLIGLEVFALSLTPAMVLPALAAVPLVLGARLIAIALPIKALSLGRQFARGAITIMVWGGLRGGISVALALSLPEGPYKPLILTVTYAVVIFSIVVQGLTVKAVVRRLIAPAERG